MPQECISVPKRANALLVTAPLPTKPRELIAGLATIHNLSRLLMLKYVWMMEFTMLLLGSTNCRLCALKHSSEYLSSKAWAHRKSSKEQVVRFSGNCGVLERCKIQFTVAWKMCVSEPVAFFHGAQTLCCTDCTCTISANDAACRYYHVAVLFEPIMTYKLL